MGLSHVFLGLQNPVQGILVCSRRVGVLAERPSHYRQNMAKDSKTCVHWPIYREDHNEKGVCICKVYSDHKANLRSDLPEAPRRAVLRSEAHVLPESHGGKGKPQIEEYLHVLNLPSEAQKRTRKVNLKSLESELEAAEKFLAIDAAYSDGHVYRNLKESSRQECYNHLAALSDTMSDSENNDDKAAYDEAVDIFNVADILFNLFLPDDFSGPTSTKFWGAVWAIVHVSLPKPCWDLCTAYLCIRDRSRATTRSEKCAGKFEICHNTLLRSKVLWPTLLPRREPMLHCHPSSSQHGSM